MWGYIRGGMLKIGCLAAAFALGMLFWANMSTKPDQTGAKPGNELAGMPAPYGMVVSSSTESIKGAVVEKVILYPDGGSMSNKPIERNGLLVRYDDAVATVLMCHGFSCDKFDTGFLRRLFPRGKFNVMSFDFRAHGEKRGNQYCTLGRDEAYDVIAAAQFLKEHPQLQGKPLYVYGFSMGAVAAIEAQAKFETAAQAAPVPTAVATTIEANAHVEDRTLARATPKAGSLFDAMILDCPFDSSENVIKRGLEQLKVSMFGYTFEIPGRQLLQKYAFHPYVQSMLRVILKAVANMDSRDIAMRVMPTDPVKTIASVSVPTCFIHCKKDEKVSIDGIKAVYNNAKSTYKTLWISNGRSHFDSYFYNPEKYTEYVRHFLDEVVAGTVYRTTKQEIIEDKDDQVVG